MKFSIITPSFNQGRFIQQTIDSVISQQGNFDIEYFIMDGGSKDETVSILKETKKKLASNSKITFYWQSRPDKGQTDAINQGLKKATGDIVSYINSDDYYLPNAFQKVADYFNNHPKRNWLVGNCQVSDIRFSWTFFLKHIWPIQYFKNALLVFNTINQPSVFLKKIFVNKIGEFDTSYHYAFDYHYWLRCIDLDLPGRIYSNLSVFRIQPNSKGNTGFGKQFDEDWQIFISRNPSNIYYFIHALARDFVYLVYGQMK